MTKLAPELHSQRTADAQNLLNDGSLTRATIYFSHYLFETYRALDQPAAFFELMGLWLDLPKQGFKTTSDQPGLYPVLTVTVGVHILCITFLPRCWTYAPTSFGFVRSRLLPYWVT